MLYVLLVVLILSIGVNGWLIWRVVRPLRRLSALTTRLAQGDLTALQQPCGGTGEVEALRHTMASMAEHVRRAQDDALSYRHALAAGQEAERERVARELHDDTVQSLVAISQSIDLAVNWMNTDSSRAEAILKSARAHAVESVDNLRRVIADLRPPALEELGVVPALQMLAQTVPGNLMELHISGVERRIGTRQELALFRLTQEAVRNAQQHGSPTCISVSLVFHSHEVHLTVKDDGAGFQLPEPGQWDCFAEENHYGIIGMQERVQQLNGTLQIDTTPGKGTTVHTVLPLDAVDQPAEAVRDPVCGAVIQPRQAYGSSAYNGEQYYFCCPVCQGAFQRHPETYLDAKNIVGVKDK